MPPSPSSDSTRYSPNAGGSIVAAMVFPPCDTLHDEVGNRNHPTPHSRSYMTPPATCLAAVAGGTRPAVNPRGGGPAPCPSASGVSASSPAPLDLVVELLPLPPHGPPDLPADHPAKSHVGSCAPARFPLPSTRAEPSEMTPATHAPAVT